MTLELAGLVAAVAASFAALGWWLARRPLRRVSRALEIGLADARAGDFGRRLSLDGARELGAVIDRVNALGDVLRQERRHLVEREMLLESVLDQNPTALVLRRDDGLVLVANRAAERLLADGHRIAGKRFADIAHGLPEPVRAAFDSQTEVVVTLPGASEHDDESYHVSNRRFTLNTRGHFLHVLRRLTPELRRHEVEVWKRVIRTISHEINNTLAPISSLAHSARLLAAKPDGREQLDEVLGHIGDSAARLKDFIAGYARFARLPEPQRTTLRWDAFLAELREVAPVGKVSATAGLCGHFDAGQLQQVLINLIKNAREAGSAADDIELRVERLTDGRSLVRVLDRGRGISDDARDKALIPFYSTKREGSGLGLALCREIAEAHGGGVDLAAREGGGTVVSVWLPGA